MTNNIKCNKGKLPCSSSENRFVLPVKRPFLPQRFTHYSFKNVGKLKDCLLLISIINVCRCSLDLKNTGEVKLNVPLLPQFNFCFGFKYFHLVYYLVWGNSCFILSECSSTVLHDASVSSVPPKIVKREQ